MASPSQEPQNTLWFHYKFTIPGNRAREFHVHLDRDTLGLVPRERTDYPEWTHLTYCQCTNCPLQREAHPRCPVAANLVDVVEYFKDVKSFEQTDVEITTANRTYVKRVPLQDGLSALIGLLMPTSGCPHLDKLRPLVHTHSPFSSLEEVTYRAVAMYWLAQFFRKQRGLEADWELEGLAKIYESVVEVNHCFHERILDVHVADAGLNALIQLDCYAQFTNRMLLRKNLGAIEKLFRAYLVE
jgi:hypothetical protein